MPVLGEDAAPSLLAPANSSTATLNLLLNSSPWLFLRSRKELREKRISLESGPGSAVGALAFAGRIKNTQAWRLSYYFTTPFSFAGGVVVPGHIHKSANVAKQRVRYYPVKSKRCHKKTQH